MTNKATVTAVCPDCGEDIELKGKVTLGRKVTCPNCDAELEVVETSPIELDWAEDEYDYEDEEDEDW